MTPGGDMSGTSLFSQHVRRAAPEVGRNGPRVRQASGDQPVAPRSSVRVILDRVNDRASRFGPDYPFAPGLSSPPAPRSLLPVWQLEWTSPL
jgi:hypothetical protein